MCTVKTFVHLVAFDLDDTLAPSKSAVDHRMMALLLALLNLTEVCVISGGNIGQFRAQLLDGMHEATGEQLSRLHLMPTCGTQYYRYLEGEWSQVYAENLSDEEKNWAREAVEKSARQLGYWEEKTWGPILEDRGSQITFSALGQSAPVEAKAAWDIKGTKKLALREAVQELVPDLEVRAGGSTSIDITRKGVDKAYGITKLAEHTGIRLEQMLFVGDRLDENGNDYPVKALGVECIAVKNWEDTALCVQKLISDWGTPALKS